MTAGSWLVTFIALTAIIRYDVWYDRPAQYAVPLLGMILRNTLNGISLGLNQLGDDGTSPGSGERERLEQLRVR